MELPIQEHVKHLLQTNAYDFFRTNKKIEHLIYLTLGGSHAYGTSTPTSDIDLRGVAFNSKKDILGFSNFEQYDSGQTDTVIYGFRKMISLLIQCNPNTIEQLGCKSEHHIYLHPIGEELIANRKMFLSKKAVSSFGGYANDQLHRLLNAFAHDVYTQSEKEQHILMSAKSAMLSFNDRYHKFGNGSFNLYVDESEKENMQSEIFVDVNLRHYPLRDYKNMFNDLSSISKLYDKLNKRNNKKDELHLNKQAMHLLRLYLMAFDILENEEIVTYREKEHDFLMDVRRGKFMKEDGTYDESFFDIVNDYEKRLKYDSENTSLPDSPNLSHIEEFVMDVNRRVVYGKI